MPTYKAVATVEDDWWIIRVPEFGGVTQARNREEIPVMARDWIACELDVKPESFGVQVTIEYDCNLHDLGRFDGGCSCPAPKE